MYSVLQISYCEIEPGSQYPEYARQGAPFILNYGFFGAYKDKSKAIERAVEMIQNYFHGMKYSTLYNQLETMDKVCVGEFTIGVVHIGRDQVHV